MLTSEASIFSAKLIKRLKYQELPDIWLTITLFNISDLNECKMKSLKYILSYISVVQYR